MATIQATINLVDNMSAKLEQITNALVDTTDAVDELDEHANKGGDATVIVNIHQAAQKAEQSVQSLEARIGSLVGKFITFKAITGALNLSDEMSQTASRINMMNDNLQSTNELVQSIRDAANRSRGSFSTMANLVARFGNNAKSAFSSAQEVVDFAEILQKQMTIAGTGTQEAANAMIQLSQAMGSGVLRGDEFNSIAEQAPNIVQAIADYMDVPKSKIREMAADGKITAQTVKKAIFASVDDVNGKFDDMPITWGQVWQRMVNDATAAVQPFLNLLSNLAGGFYNVYETIQRNGEALEPVITALAGAVTTYAVAMGAVELATKGAAVAQAVFNALVETNPIILVLSAVIGLLVATSQYIADVTGKATTGLGIITGCLNVVVAAFKNLLMSAGNVASAILSVFSAMGQNLVTLMEHPIETLKAMFYDLLSTVMGIIGSIATHLNKLPFISIDVEGLTSAADEYAQKAKDIGNDIGDYTSISDAFNEGISKFETWQEGWESDAFTAGSKWGDSLLSNASKYDLPGEDAYDDISDIADSTATTAKAVSTSQEDLKYLRDIAEQEVINRFTTAEISVSMGGVTNNVSNDTDLDGVINYLVTGVQNAMSVAAEGVHI